MKPSRLPIAVLSSIVVLLAGAALARPAAAAESSVTIGTHGMKATLIAPDGSGPYPGVVVLHTSGGLEDADLDFARDLAKQGYVCLVPAFMAAYGITSETRQETFTRDRDDIESDLTAGVAALHADPRVGASPVGAVGFSNGGYFAAWLALAGKVGAGVGYYGAYTGAATDRDESTLRAVAAAKSSPFLILHGEEDDTVPVAAARRLAQILKAAGATYQIYTYPDAGHRFERAGVRSIASGFSNGGRHPGKGGDAGQAQPTGDAAAASDAWTQTLAFFSAYLAGH
jgi:carboxymethylenebutenolidase